MRIGYRLTSLTYVILYVTHIVVSSLLSSRASPGRTVPDAPGVAEWDPCYMWEQIPALIRVSTLIFLFSFLTVLIQGFRNRPAARWVALLAVAGLVPTVQHSLWRVRLCYSNFNKVGFWIELTAIGLVCIHHIIP